MDFSIIIPSYNRPQRLAQCLSVIAQLDYPREKFEAIVVDDGSFEPLDNVVAPFQEQLDLSLIRQDNAGAAKARNTGAQRARGRFLAFTDDDCTPSPHWLTALAQGLTSAPNCLIGGRILNALEDNLFSTASQLLIDYLYSYYNADPERARFFTSNNMAIATEIFLAVGGFDTTYPRAASEDRELCDRLSELGYGLRYVPEATVSHAHHLGWRSFWQQHFYYGRGAYCFHQIRDRRQAPPIAVEPMSFYWQMLLYPWASSARQPKLLLSPLLFLSQVAGVAGFTWEKRHSQGKAFSRSVS